jgi:hypothetical protein
VKNIFQNIILYCAWWYVLNILKTPKDKIAQALLDRGWTRNYYRLPNGNYGEIYRINNRVIKIEVE